MLSYCAQVVQDPRFLAVEARLSRQGFRELVAERFIHLPIMLWSTPLDPACLVTHAWQHCIVTLQRCRVGGSPPRTVCHVLVTVHGTSHVHSATDTHQISRLLFAAISILRYVPRTGLLEEIAELLGGLMPKTNAANLANISRRCGRCSAQQH